MTGYRRTVWKATQDIRDALLKTPADMDMVEAQAKLILSATAANRIELSKPKTMCQTCKIRAGLPCLETELIECAICHDRHAPVGGVSP